MGKKQKKELEIEQEEERRSVGEDKREELL